MPLKTTHKSSYKRRLARAGIPVEDKGAVIVCRSLTETRQCTDNSDLLVVGIIREVAKNLCCKFVGAQNLVLQIIGNICYYADSLDIRRVLVAVVDGELSLAGRLDLAELTV